LAKSLQETVKDCGAWYVASRVPSENISDVKGLTGGGAVGVAGCQLAAGISYCVDQRLKPACRRGVGQVRMRLQ